MKTGEKITILIAIVLASVFTLGNIIFRIHALLLWLLTIAHLQYKIRVLENG